MANVYFCKTRYQDIGYLSYRDFFKLVDLAGYPTIYVDQIDPQSDNTYIITPLNGEWLNGWENPKAQIIHWELEWRTDERKEWQEPPGVKRVWASDAWFARHYNYEYVPLGGHPRLNELPISPHYVRSTDVSMLAYMTPRRQEIYNQLGVLGVSIEPPEGFLVEPPEKRENRSGATRRSLSLVSSWAMVHVHQFDNIPTIAPSRWALAAAHVLPVISETVRERGIFGYTHMMQADYRYLSAFVRDKLRDKRLLQDYAMALFSLLCIDKTFKKVVEAHL